MAEGLEELEKGVRRARGIAVAANLLWRPRLLAAPREAGGEGALDVLPPLLLKLYGAGGSAPLSALDRSDPYRALAALEELERHGLVRVVRTATRTYAVLTPMGRRLAESLLRALAQR